MSAGVPGALNLVWLGREILQRLELKAKNFDDPGPRGERVPTRPPHTLSDIILSQIFIRD